MQYYDDALYDEMGGFQMIKTPQLDWAFGRTSGESPRMNRYAFTAHYLWRDFDKNDKVSRDVYYSDRMNMWDHEKYQHAFSTDSDEFGVHEKRPSLWAMTKEQATIIVKRYFGEEFECAGYILDCNHSSGYELGVFVIE